MLTSVNLCSVPFLGNTDSTRLQMSTKQMAQTLTNTRCEVPKVIGSNFRYLTDSVRMFKLVAPEDGEVCYVNDELMIIHFDSIGVEVYPIMPVIKCNGYNGTRLRYRREQGPFKKGDLIYEYDSFKMSLPSYGYNLMTAYMPWYGYNHEDSLVISESAAKRCCSTKYDHIVIPIYTYSLFNLNLYPNKLGFIPDIGEQINDDIIGLKKEVKGSKTPFQKMKTMNLSEFSSIVDSKIDFNATPIYSKFKDGIVNDLRIHRIRKDIELLDKNLDNIVKDRKQVYDNYLSNTLSNIYKIFPNRDFINEVALEYYLFLKQNSSGAFKTFDTENLVYIIELFISKDNHVYIGDKMANRYANKGVVSLILPDELRPYLEKDGTPIDIITGPITPLSRMNFGQNEETIVSNAIIECENEILKNRSPENISQVLQKLSGLASCLNDNQYAENIINLSNQVLENTDVCNRFLSSIDQIGLYFEVPNFSHFDINELQNYIMQNMGVSANNTVIIPKETNDYMTDLLKIDVPKSPHDIRCEKINTGCVYTMKLKQEAESRLTTRDFGAYKATNKQPIKGRDQNKMGGSSRLGQMELLDGLLAHNVPSVIKEFRTVKNDDQDQKGDLTCQIVVNGEYNLPNNISTKNSYIKMIIDSLIKYITD